MKGYFSGKKIFLHLAVQVLFYAFILLLLYWFNAKFIYENGITVNAVYLIVWAGINSIVTAVYIGINSEEKYKALCRCACTRTYYEEVNGKKQLNYYAIWYNVLFGLPISLLLCGIMLQGGVNVYLSSAVAIIIGVGSELWSFKTTAKILLKHTKKYSSDKE